MSVRVHPMGPVIALDLDGTVAAYHEHFRWFAKLYLQRSVEAKWYPGYRGEFSLALGLDKTTYRDIKLAYRQGAMKRSLPVLRDERDLLRESVAYLRSMGIQVWVTTTRAWQRLDNIDPDTRFWIDQNIGQIDGLIYGEDKYADLVDIVGRDRVLGVFDDLPENIVRAGEIGLNSCLRIADHNAWWRGALGGGDDQQNLCRDAGITLSYFSSIKQMSSVVEFSWNKEK